MIDGAANDKPRGHRGFRRGAAKPLCGAVSRKGLRWYATLATPCAKNVRTIASTSHYFSANEHDLAPGSGFKDLFMRAGRLGEWQFFAHDGAQRAICEPRNEPGVDVRLFGRCNVPKGERAN